MKTTVNIPKSPKLKKGEDFDFLRKEGIHLLQEFSGSTWTDHNLHDPGITLLEAFCYMLTELSLKANLDISDILASSQENSDQAMYGPKEIFHARATTLNDYRKILIDIDEVRNAWLLPLSVQETGDVNGLYDVLLELEDDSILGDMNSGIIERSFSINYGPGDDRDYVIEVSFPAWNEVPAFNEVVTIDNVTSEGLLSVTLFPAPLGSQNDFRTNLEVTFNGGSLVVLPEVAIRVTPLIGNDPAENTAVGNQIISILSRDSTDGLPGEPILTSFNRQVAAASIVRDNVLQVLRQNRNLGEDLRSIRAIGIQEIGLNVTFDLLKPINLEKYLATVLLELELFFKPHIRFSSLTTLEAEGISYEDIFEGPFLSNGFLDDLVLNNLGGTAAKVRQSTIYVSDLVNLLIGNALKSFTGNVNLIEDQTVVISAISISNYIRNQIYVQDASDCLVLEKFDLNKPRFSFNKSNIRFFRNGIEVTYNGDLVNSILDQLRTERLTTDKGSLIPLLSKGDVLPIGEFHSIQNDFPAVYGLAKNVLSEAYPSEQRAKIEQFRGYLTLIDQLLESQGSQLLHINDLFSIRSEVAHTYFRNSLYSLPYLERLLVDFLNSGQSWDDFQNDPLNTYPEEIEAIFESRVVFLDRRNRFLDHLLARFAASIQNYISYRYEEASSNVVSTDELELRRQEIAYDLILDKINYLTKFPEHSRDRFAALDYSAVAWDTLNTSGLSKRLATAFGFRNLERRTGYTEVVDFIQINSVGPNFDFEILNAGLTPILQSESVFPNAIQAETEARALIQYGINRNNYYLEPPIAIGGPHTIGIKNDPSIVAPYLATASVPPSNDEFEARLQIRSIIRELQEIGSAIYVVEHILLRPSADSILTLNIPGPNSESVSNPYSMRITVILPSGFERDFAAETDPEPTIPAQFQDEKFRIFAEKQIKEEAPAHMLPTVFWLDQNTTADVANTPSLNNFTERWRAWLEAKEDPLSTPAMLETRRDELITVLNAIYQTVV